MLVEAFSGIFWSFSSTIDRVQVLIPISRWTVVDATTVLPYITEEILDMGISCFHCRFRHRAPRVTILVGQIIEHADGFFHSIKDVLVDLCRPLYLKPTCFARCPETEGAIVE